jgi:hypothetical protein
MVSGGASRILDAYDEPDGLEQEFACRNRASESKIDGTPAVHAEEARWIADRIGRDHLDQRQRTGTAPLSGIRRLRCIRTGCRCSTRSPERRRPDDIS